MSLTAQEEALVRQLLDQQAALLSLAGNEATITSKLGATKVTLSDLVAASSVADADLFLTRQGVTDKSVTAAILAQYAMSELAGNFVDAAGDTMTGALVLNAGGTTPTPALFDNDTSLATTEFIKRAGLSLPADGTTLSANTTLTAAQAGNWFEVNTNGVIVTLPALADVPNGTIYSFKGSINTWTIKGNGSENINKPDSTGGNTYAVSPSESVLVVKGTSTWAILIAGFGGTAFVNSPTTAGYQKLPSGLIIQWALSNTTGTSGSIVYPIAFPTACHVVVATDFENVAPLAIGTTAYTTTQFDWAASSPPNFFNWIAIGS